MKKTEQDDTSSEKVTKATRDAVIKAAARLQKLANQSAKLAAEAEKKWQESKPRQQKLKNDLQKIAEQIVAFGNEVSEGLKQGFAEVKRKNNRKS